MFKSHFQSKAIFTLFFTVFCILLTLGQLQRVQLTPQIAFYLHDVLLIIWILIFHRSFTYLFVKINKEQLRKPFLLLLIYICAQTIIISLFSGQFAPILYLCRFGLFAGFFILLKQGVRQQLITSKILFNNLIHIGLGITILGFAQYLFLPDTRFLYEFGWDDHYYRLISTLFDPGFTAIVLVMILGILIYKWIKDAQFQYLVFSVGVTIAIGLTFSRAGYLSLATLLLVLTWQYRQIRILGLGVILGLTILIAPKPGGEGVNLTRTYSISQRVESNQGALQRLTPFSLLFGNGMYNNPIETETDKPFHATTPDNSFVFILTSFGLVGTMLLAWTAWQARSSFTHPVIVATLPAIIVDSTFNNALVYPWVLLIGGMMVIGFGKKVNQSGID